MARHEHRGSAPDPGLRADGTARLRAHHDALHLERHATATSHAAAHYPRSRCRHANRDRITATTFRTISNASSVLNSRVIRLCGTSSSHTWATRLRHESTSPAF